MRAWILLLGSLLLPGVVDGTNSCVAPESADYRCQAGVNRVQLNECGLTDADIEDVDACLDTVGRDNIHSLYLRDNLLTTPTAELFQGLAVLDQLYLENNQLISLPPGVFDGLGTLTFLHLQRNALSTLPEGLFNDLQRLGSLDLRFNQLIDLPDGIFAGLGQLGYLYLVNNQLNDLPLGVFAGLGQLNVLYLGHNRLNDLPLGVFDGLGQLYVLRLESNDLTTLPEGLFNDLDSLANLYLAGNDRLQCVPDTDADVDVEPLGPCECTPPAAVMCDVGLDCAPGASGYTCEMAMHKLGGEPHLSDVRSTDIV